VRGAQPSADGLAEKSGESGLLKRTAEAGAHSPVLQINP
jgi:hypothetical protein